MSWMQRFCETYDACFGQPQFAGQPIALTPVGSVPQNTQLHVTVHDDGTFCSASLSEERGTTMFVTEDSAGRSGTDPAANPLTEQLEYCAKGMERFQGDANKHVRYIALLESWAKSEFGDSKISAVLSYVKAGSLLEDLLAAGVLTAQGDTLAKVKISKTLKIDPAKLWVRWSVLSSEQDSDTWSDGALANKWISFDLSLSKAPRLCMLTGKVARTTQKHPKRLRSGGDNAKIISANDNKSYTFRGRFTDSEAALTVGYVDSQKAHNSLRWLIARQGYRNGDQVIVAWAVQTAQDIPVVVATADLPWLQEGGAETEAAGTEASAPPAEYRGDAGQAYSRRLSRAVQGYRAQLGEQTDIVVMALDSATPGRMAIPYYREFKGSEFLTRLEQWHSQFAWPQNFGKDRRFVGAPAPRDIAEAAYGRRVDDKLRKATVERLLPCIVDNRPLPRDLELATVRRATNRVALEPWEFERVLGIACALVRGAHPKEQYRMSLDDTRNTRDYLYGRLLAVADNIEELAQIVAKEERDTNAMRLMQRFADHPFETWRTIELQLRPYIARLRGSKFAGALSKRKDLLDELQSRLTSLGEGTKPGRDKRLDGEFLLGYHSQREELRRKKTGEPSSIEEQDQPEGVLSE